MINVFMIGLELKIIIIIIFRIKVDSGIVLPRPITTVFTYIINKIYFNLIPFSYPFKHFKIENHSSIKINYKNL